MTSQSLINCGRASKDALPALVFGVNKDRTRNRSPPTIKGRSRDLNCLPCLFVEWEEQCRAYVLVGIGSKKSK